MTRWSAWHCRVHLTHPLLLKRGTLTERELLLLRFQDEQGIYWSEATPLPDWSADSLQDNLQACQHLARYRSPQQALDGQQWPAALSTALALMPFSMSPAAHISNNRLILSADQPASTTPKTFKLKVGRLPIDETAEQINQFCLQLHDEQRLRLDANQSWSYAEVRSLQGQLLQPEKIEYIEEPLLPELSYRQWSENCSLPFAYDERLLTEKIDAYAGLAAYIVKPTILGWPICQQLRQQAQRANIQLILSSSFETPLLLNKLSQLAAHWQLESEQGLSTSDYIDSVISDRQWPLTRLEILATVLT